jgi:hypothetical protein
VLKTLKACIDAHEPSRTDEVDRAEGNENPYTPIDLTPREKHVLAALELGL